MGFSSSEVLTGNCSGFLPYAISTICTACEWRKRRRWCRRSLCTIACCGCWSKQGTTTVVTVLLRICRILAIGFKISENERTHVAVNTGFSKASFAPGGLLWCCFWHLGLGGTARWLAFGQDNGGFGLLTQMLWSIFIYFVVLTFVWNKSKEFLLQSFRLICCSFVGDRRTRWSSPCGASKHWWHDLQGLEGLWNSVEYGLECFSNIFLTCFVFCFFEAQRFFFVTIACLNDARKLQFILTWLWIIHCRMITTMPLLVCGTLKDFKTT